MTAPNPTDLRALARDCERVAQRTPFVAGGESIEAYQFDALSGAEIAAKFSAAAAALEAAAAALEQHPDTPMLDWLFARCSDGIETPIYESLSGWRCIEPRGEDNEPEYGEGHPTPRAAIRAAMSASADPNAKGRDDATEPPPPPRR